MKSKRETIMVVDDDGNKHYGFPLRKLLNNSFKCVVVSVAHHRLDGPAIEYADGSHSWYINNQKILNYKRYIKNLNPNQLTILKLKYGEINE